MKTLAALCLLAAAHAAYADPPQPEHRKIDISVDPVGPVFGYWDGAVSYGVSNKVAIAASMARWPRDSRALDEWSGWFQFTLGAPIFFERLYHGVFLEPGVVVRTQEYEEDLRQCTNCEGLDPWQYFTWAGPQVLLGWQWTAPSGLSFAVAAGAALHLYESYAMEPAPSRMDVNGYFRVGYAF